MKYEQEKIEEIKHNMEIDRKISLIADIVLLLGIIVILILKSTKVLDETVSYNLCLITLIAFMSIELSYIYGTLRNLRSIIDINNSMINKLSKNIEGDEDCDTNSRN